MDNDKVIGKHTRHEAKTRNEHAARSLSRAAAVVAALLLGLLVCWGINALAG